VGRWFRLKLVGAVVLMVLFALGFTFLLHEIDVVAYKLSSIGFWVGALVKWVLLAIAVIIMVMFAISMVIYVMELLLTNGKQYMGG